MPDGKGWAGRYHPERTGGIIEKLIAVCAERKTLEDLGLKCIKGEIGKASGKIARGLAENEMGLGLGMFGKPEMKFGELGCRICEDGWDGDFKPTGKGNCDWE